MEPEKRPESRYLPRPTRIVWALVADLEGSRALPDRFALARRLEGVLASLRRESARTGAPWLAPLESVRGLDELSGVLHRPGPALQAVFRLTLELWPHRFRFALARGTLDVGLGSGQAGAMDGPAFHRAADALQRARREKLPLALAVPGWPREAGAVIEGALRLHAVLTAAWTPRQAETVRVWRRLNRQREVARALGVTQPTVSEILSKARARELLALEEDLPRHLDWLARTLPATEEPASPHA